MLSAFSVEQCPPSHWNTVRHQYGIVSAIAWNTHIGHAKLTGPALLCFATYHLVRMGSLGGWWDAHHA